MKAARLAIVLSVLAGCEHDPPPPPLCPITATPGTSVLPLSTGWQVRAAEEVGGSDVAVATTGYSVAGWHATDVPATVVGALVGDGTYPDPFPGMNLRTYPGVDYRVGAGFFNLEMSDESPFRKPWWYRTEFAWPGHAAGRHAWLRLDGVNHRANVFLNGRPLADDTQIVGTFRRFELEVTDSLTSCGPNALALKVRAQRLQDLGWNFVDWSPGPPDKDMGLWRPVSIYTTGAVRLRWPRISSVLDGGVGPGARLTVRAELENAESQAVDATFTIAFDDRVLRVPVKLAAHELRELVILPDEHPELVLGSPRLWWPFSLGEPALHDVRFTIEVDGTASDETTQRFGIREITSELTDEGYRLFRVNGHPFQIRGAGWTPDILLREPAERIIADVDYVRDMNLNTIRLEGKSGFPAMYDRADELGVLILAGFCCCDRWEMWGDWTDENRRVAVGSLRDQARELAAHPSVLAWMNGSDNVPADDVEKLYYETMAQLGWPNPQLPSAAATNSPTGGPSGVKMPGPYQWVPPVYWSTDTGAGGAFGFDTETSAGAAIPPLESLERFLPPDHRWPYDEVWAYHSGTADFVYLNEYDNGLNARYGAPTGIEDYARKGQLVAYEGVRAMFEAYARRKYHATGVIQWMLNNAWPGLLWHLYDVYLKPGGGYFGAKIANETLHAQFGYDDHAVIVVNHALTPRVGLTVRAHVIAPSGVELHLLSAPVSVEADGVVTAFTVPAYGDLPRTYLLVVDLDEGAARLTRNVYWLSTEPDVLDWDTNNGFVTQTVSYADLKGLHDMPMSSLTMTATRTHDDAGDLVRVTLMNPGTMLAFFERVELALGDNERELVPVRWSDNYVTLLPGETRVLEARVALPPSGTAITVRGEGWNVARSTALLTE